eukprot:COSAG02_NODE_1957_length_10261_cov_51.399134_8_plen_53_part_00
MYNRVLMTGCEQAEVTVWSNSATEEVVLQASASVDSLEGNHFAVTKPLFRTI